jgi:uncharacterized membrane protein
MKWIFGILLFSAVVFFTSCEYHIIEPEIIVLPDEPVSFSTQVAPMFDKCVTCHTSSNRLNMESNLYTNLVTGKSQDNISYIDIANPEASYIYTKTVDHPDGNMLTAEERAYLIKWITEGARNN